jgi:LysR family transcriptional activator of nhaA
VTTWLNYHHLYYFWLAAREGGVSAAARKLRLAQPTVSRQVRALEAALGAPLFDRRGGRVALTAAGRTALRHADDIFARGRDLVAELAGAPGGAAARLNVGVADALPKLVVARVLEAVVRAEVATELTCREGPAERLLGELATHALDVVLGDAPADPADAVRARSLPVGDSGVSFFAAPALAARLTARPFPARLDGAPFVLPPRSAPLRRALTYWFERLGLRPAVVAECDDSALVKALGGRGAGVFVAPTAIAAEVRRQYGVRSLGRTRAVREHFYVITAGRREHDPAVRAIVESARALLAPGPAGAH